MTAAPHIAIGILTNAIEDTSFSVFQLNNGPQSTQLVCGNFFLGLQSAIAVVVPLDTAPSLALARGGKILTDLLNCAVTFTADGNFAAGQILCNVMVDDGPRGGLLDSRLAAKAYGGTGFLSPTGWRQDRDGVFDQRLEDTGGTPFIDNGTGNAASGLTILSGLRDEIGARFTVPAGPGWSVARAICLMRRWGNPTGSMEVAIQGTSFDGEGHEFPDGVDLGVSAGVLNSSIALNPGSTAATFAFAPDVVLAPGDYWTVMRPVGAPYPADFTNFVGWLQRRLFVGGGLGPAAHRHTAPWFRFDAGNYPGHRDVSEDLAAKEVGTAITWNIPSRTAGQTAQSPDLSPLVQEVILREGHETANALIFTFRTVAQTPSFRFAAYGHPTRAAPGFVAQYSRRHVRAEGAQ